jgi:hypothetical protein
MLYSGNVNSSSNNENQITWASMLDSCVDSCKIKLWPNQIFIACNFEYVIHSSNFLLSFLEELITQVYILYV